MARLQPVRGTHDILGEDVRRFRHVVETYRDLAERYCFGEIATPIFEFTEVFARTLGETSDIVTKEMYTFEDRGGASLTLRPEGTAGVARALISGGLSQHLPLKLYYQGPMFRYERPQKGRLRQFHQIGAEYLGAAEPEADVECIALGARLLTELGVADRVRLLLNSLGDGESRSAYRDVLVAYLSAHRDALSEESRARLERNPLRILDSKDPGDRRLIADAPPLEAHLNAHSADFFAAVRARLDRLDIRYEIDPRLVRGLDYYNHTAFEFVTDALGAQGAVIAGGRYDGLVAAMGGPATPGVGWAGGIERLAALLAAPPEAVRPLAVIPVGAGAEAAAHRLAMDLRNGGHTVDVGVRGNLSKRMKQADRIGARLAILLGEDELARGVATLKDLDSGDQRTVKLAALASELGGPARPR